MDKWHLIVVLDRYKKKPKRQSYERILLPFGFLVTGAIALATSSEFHAAIGLSGASWKSVIFIITVISGLFTLIFFVSWIKNVLCYKERTTQEEVAEIIKEIDDEQREANLKQRRE